MTHLKSAAILLHYRILEKIGEGGMGAVYKAEDLKLGRHVAIKLLLSEATEDEKAKKRLLREARAASTLHHPNIVTIHAIEEADGLDFIVMEYVEGESLRARIERGPLEVEDLLDLGSQIAHALGAAHEVGIIHRDIKPGNILTTLDGQAKLVDFGLAGAIAALPEEVKSEEETLEALTQAGVIVGTLGYMSPEQVRGESLDGRSDIFSLGCVLYEAATGKQPFAGATAVAVIQNISNLDSPSPSTIQPGLPRELDLVIGRALAKDKDLRFSSASELAEALEDLRGVAISEPSAVGAETERETFVGRELEMDKLHELLRDAAAGSGRVAFLAGEPGIGKSALAEEFLRVAQQKRRGLICGRGRCLEQFGTGEAYLPFLDALGNLLAGPERERIRSVLKHHAPTWCLQLHSAFPSSGEWDELQQETIGATKERMIREMGDALGALAVGSPTIFLLEDLHWADPSSIDLLRHLGQRVSEQRLLLLGTFRPAELEVDNHPLKSCRQEMLAHRQCQELALGVLSREEISHYLDARFAPNDFSGELAALIDSKTEGHPLFSNSLVQFLVDGGHIARRNEHWSLIHPLSETDLEVPESVRGMVRRQMETLEEDDRKALQYASVEGEEFLSTVLATLLGVDELDLEERLDRLARKNRLIEPSGEVELPDGSLATRYRFAHALYQNVLYGDIVTKRRVLLHRKAAEQLVGHYGDDAPSIAAQLAMHFEQGREFGRAVEYLIHAGDNATRRYAYPEVKTHFARALDLVEKLPKEEQTQRLITLHQKRGVVNQVMGRFDEAIDDSREMLRWALTAHDLETECLARNGLVMALFYSYRIDEMEAEAEEALRAADRAGSPARRADALVAMIYKAFVYGEMGEAKVRAEEILRIARPVDHKPAVQFGLQALGATHHHQSEFEAAEKFVSQAVSLASELRDGFQLLMGLKYLSMIQGNQGRMSEALSTLRELQNKAERNGDRYFPPRVPNIIGWIRRELQSFEEAARYDERSHIMAHENGIREVEANALIDLAHFHTHSGNKKKAASLCREVEKIFERDDFMRWRWNIRLQAAKCECALAEGDLSRAKQDGLRVLEMATRYRVHKYIAIGHKLLAEVAVAGGDSSEAETELNAALDELNTYPSPLVAWKTYALLGRLRVKMGDRSSAREAYSQAADIVRMIASNVDDEKLRATFLGSPAVREVLDGADKRSPGTA